MSLPAKCWQYLFVVICTVFLRHTFAIHLIDPEVKEKVDNFIQNVYMPANRNPALGLAITNSNGTLLYTTGFGLMDIEKQLSTSNETLFLIGSVSKSFASVIISKTLHEKFPTLPNVLDTPVRKLIPEFNFTLNDRYRSEETTFRDMLSHRVCSKTDELPTFAVPFNSAKEVTYRQRYAPQDCGFRTSFVYNNGMYALASEAIEAIAGRSYHSLLEEFLEDLGMHSTTYVKESDKDEIDGRAVPYYRKNGKRLSSNLKLLKIVVFDTAAGGVVSTAEDMSRYLQFHLNKGKVGERQVVPEKVMEWIYQPAIHFSVKETNFKPARNDISFSYGLGIFVGSVDGWLRYSHSGSVPPYSTRFSLYPALRIGIFTSINQEPVNPTLDQPELHNAIFDILQGSTPSSHYESIPDSKPVEENREMAELMHRHSHDGLSPEKYTGLFGNGLQGEIEISLKLRNETNSIELYMTYGEWGHAFLLETGNLSTFRIHWDSDTIHDWMTISLGLSNTFGMFDDNITQFKIIDDDQVSRVFYKDVSLANLPPIPWTPDSCGPVTKND